MEISRNQCWTVQKCVKVLNSAPAFRLGNPIHTWVCLEAKKNAQLLHYFSVGTSALSLGTLFIFRPLSWQKEKIKKQRLPQFISRMF